MSLIPGYALREHPQTQVCASQRERITLELTKILLQCAQQSPQQVTHLRVIDTAVVLADYMIEKLRESDHG